MIEINITPVPRPRMTRKDKWAPKKSVVRYWVFCRELRDKLKGFELKGHATIIFYMPMPKSWSKKKKAKLQGQPHTQRPDIDNLIKAILDGLLEEDSGVHTIQAQKLWAKSGKILISSEEFSLVKE